MRRKDTRRPDAPTSARLPARTGEDNPKAGESGAPVALAAGGKIEKRIGALTAPSQDDISGTLLEQARTGYVRRISELRQLNLAAVDSSEVIDQRLYGLHSWIATVVVRDLSRERLRDACC